MPVDHPAWIEHQRTRWTRHDAHRWFKPTYEPKAKPAPKAAPAAGDLLEAVEEARRGQLRPKSMLIDLQIDLFRRSLARKYSADQPRVPAGSSDGGQWMNGGTSEGISTDVSAARKARGHHFVPQSLYRDLPLRADTREVLEQATTGPLRGERHGWSKAHDSYNQAVGEHFDRYLERNNIKPENLTSDQAHSFVKEIRSSRDPRIRDFNMRIFRQEFRYWLRGWPRGRE
jgi:hypothetical protein